jgi:D-lactate dehydrogenase (cytochrome)
LIRITPSSWSDEATDCSPSSSICGNPIIQSEYPDYLRDESKLTGFADALHWIHSEKQASELLREANASKVPMTFSGGRTGIVGGAVPQGGLLVSMERMNRLKNVCWDENRSAWLVRVEPGMTLEDLESKISNAESQESTPQRWIEESIHWFYPPDPTEKSAQIGGTVATNASGARSFAYGPTRSWISSIRVLLADGTPFELFRGMNKTDLDGRILLDTFSGPLQIEIPDFKMPAVKHAAGYCLSRPMDLIDLFIGSEGTLGLITEVELVLSRKPEGLFSGLAFFKSSFSALDFVFRAREGMKTSNLTLRPDALEYFDSRTIRLLEESSSVSIPDTPLKGAAVYFEQKTHEAGIEEALEAYDRILKKCGSSIDCVWGAMDELERTRLVAFRHAVPENINRIIAERQQQFPSIHKVGTDFVVPDRHLSEMMNLYEKGCGSTGIDYVIFGHIGDNHLHVNMMPKNPEELDLAKTIYARWAAQAVQWGGSVSGEHGIGKLKRNLMAVQFDANSLAQMRAIKGILDPKDILGRGNLFV